MTTIHPGVEQLAAALLEITPPCYFPPRGRACLARSPYKCPRVYQPLSAEVVCKENRRKHNRYRVRDIGIIGGGCINANMNQNHCGADSDEPLSDQSQSMMQCRVRTDVGQCCNILGQAIIMNPPVYPRDAFPKNGRDPCYSILSQRVCPWIPTCRYYDDCTVQYNTIGQHVGRMCAPACCVDPPINTIGQRVCSCPPCGQDGNDQGGLYNVIGQRLCPCACPAPRGSCGDDDPCAEYSVLGQKLRRLVLPPIEHVPCAEVMAEPACFFGDCDTSC